MAAPLPDDLDQVGSRDRVQCASVNSTLTSCLFAFDVYPHCVRLRSWQRLRRSVHCGATLPRAPGARFGHLVPQYETQYETFAPQSNRANPSAAAEDVSLEEARARKKGRWNESSAPIQIKLKPN